MLPLALTTMEKIHQVPRQFWIGTAIVVVCLIAIVFIFRFLREMNKIVLTIIIAMVLAIVGFSWIYERNEPAFLTPTINVLAQFFPSKGSYNENQKKDITEGKSKPTPAKPSR